MKHASFIFGVCMRELCFTQACVNKAVPILLHFCRTERHLLPFSGKPAPVEESCFTQDLHSTHIYPHDLVTVLVSDWLLISPETLKDWFICQWLSFKFAHAGIY